MRGSQGSYSNGPIWLVKAADRILGPFTSEEIGNKLRNKELVPIDEITPPMARWRVIRDEPTFYGVVDELRKGQLSAREDTEIQGQTHATMTLTTDEVSVSTDMPTNAVVPIDKSYDSSRILDAEFIETPTEPVARTRSTTETGTFKKAPTLPQYGVGQTSSERSSGVATAAWIFAAIAITTSFIVYMRSQTQTTKEPTTTVVSSGQNLDAVLIDAERSWRNGDFKAALDGYRAANRIKPKSPEILSRLGPLVILIEGQTVQAKRGLQDALASLPANGENGVRSEIETGIGLAAMVAEDYSEADARFRLALAAVPTSFPAQFNSGMAAYLMKSYDEAARRFSAVGDEPAALLMTARARLAAAGSGRKAAPNTAVPLNRIIEKYQDYLQEALVTSAYFDLDSNNKKQALIRVRQALEVDPELTRDHWHDPSLFLDPLAWKSILPYCRRLNEELKTVTSRGLYSLCLFKGGKREEATETLNDALSRSPEDPVLRSIAAYQLAGSERMTEARAALKLIPSRGAPRMATLLRGRLCEQANDDACTDEAWQELMRDPAPPLAAIVGVAKLRAKGGDQEGARIMLEKVKTLSPNYRPAMLFKTEAPPAPAAPAQ